MAKNTALFVEEENQFQKYAKQVMEAAEKAERDVLPLLRTSGQCADTARARKCFFLYIQFSCCSLYCLTQDKAIFHSLLIFNFYLHTNLYFI